MATDKERDEDFNRKREVAIKKIFHLLNDDSGKSQDVATVDIVLRIFGMECLVEGCHRRTRSNNLCMKHWQNARAKYHKVAVNFFEESTENNFENWLEDTLEVMDD